MRLSDRTKWRRQRGASLVEFCFTIPVLLLVAGSTVDLSRYMRFLQVTTFVSQETAEQIYRQCSDITIYTPADISTTSLTINQAMTEGAITSCVERLQLGAQELLNATVGRAAVSSKVFRWQITQTSPSTSCGSVTTLSSANVSVMYAKADVDCDDAENGGINTPVATPASGSPNKSKKSSIIRRDDDERNYEKSRSSLDDDETEEKLALEDDGVDLQPTGIYQTKSTSGTPRLLVSPSTLCQKSRVATVEVAYAFEPIVKFLPHMMIKLNTDGSQRETTAL
jgi:Flp pilus assembly protein TadG